LRAKKQIIMTAKKSTIRRSSRRATPRTKTATPPPSNPRTVNAPGGTDGPRLWFFKHTHPQIPGVVTVTVQAPDLQNARGAAYLLAEQFTQNVIGFIKAEAPAHDPRR